MQTYRANQEQSISCYFQTLVEVCDLPWKQLDGCSSRFDSGSYTSISARRIASKLFKQDVLFSRLFVISGITDEYFQHQQSLVKKLTENSTIIKEILPVVNASSPVELKLSLALYQISNLVSNLQKLLRSERIASPHETSREFGF